MEKHPEMLSSLSGDCPIFGFPPEQNDGISQAGTLIASGEAPSRSFCGRGGAVSRSGCEGASPLAEAIHGVFAGRVVRPAVADVKGLPRWQRR